MYHLFFSYNTVTGFNIILMFTKFSSFLVNYWFKTIDNLAVKVFIFLKNPYMGALYVTLVSYVSLKGIVATNILASVFIWVVNMEKFYIFR